MWRKWRPNVIESDFKLLAAEGLDILRIFPLWPDFQPIHLLRADTGRSIEYRWDEVPLPDDNFISDGVSPEMMDRLEMVVNLADKHGIKIIVGLITGWMSGRLFVPPALEGLNHLTDPTSIKWQVRLVRVIVERLSKYPHIVGWDLGNECNVMGPTTADQAWNWTATISNAIRVSDATRPVISGMHSLKCDPTEAWNIRDQGELTDILTTHPYSLFTPHCQREPLNTMRPILHATAETRLYMDISKRPAFVEEFGSLGPMNAGDEESGAYVRACLVSQWAHGGKAALWWCAFDQTLLEEAPYDWLGLESELGLIRTDGTSKPALEQIKSFAKTLKDLPFDHLPPHAKEAVCVLTPGQDQWAVAYSAFILAKQAGFEVHFHFSDQALPEADLYMFPSLKGFRALSRRREIELWNRVKAGATVYISWENSGLSGFSKTGLHVAAQSERKGPCEFTLSEGNHHFSVPTPIKLTLTERGASILARDSKGIPVFSVMKYGKGKVYFLSVPLEAAAANTNEHFLPENDPGWSEIYRVFAAGIIAKRKIRKTNPWIGITEHRLSEDQFVAILINYHSEPMEDSLVIAKDWAVESAFTGKMPDVLPSNEHRISLPGNGFAIWSFNLSSKANSEAISISVMEPALT